MVKLTLKNKQREAEFFNKRLTFISIFLLLFVLILIGRLTYLQIWQHQRYTTLSNQNQVSLISIEPARGLIYDRNGVTLAENMPTFSLDIIPYKVKNIHKTLSSLNKIIPLSASNIHDFYKLLQQKRRFEPVPLKVKLTEDEIARFAVNQWRFPGVVINTRLLRSYPQGSTLASVVGYVGRINENELRNVNAINYSATNYIGKTGIEKYFENILHGKVGYQQVEIDASGRIVRVLKRIPPIAGDNLYLTIDSNLQKIAADAFKDNAGALVALQPSTGQILAMVSHPSYDPNLFVQGMSAQAFKELENAPNKPLYNRTIRGLYPPGSTIKPIMALEALSAGVIYPEDSIFDPGYFQYANHTYKDWMPEGHGWVNLEKAIIYSCDTYFYNLAIRLRIRRIDEVLHNFGFGELTHVELGEELPGLVPTPLWKRAHKNLSWFMGDTIITSIGQGSLLATPLQLAVATSILAEHGKHYQPHLLLTAHTSRDKIIHQPTIELSYIESSPANWLLIQKAMHEVIMRGTGIIHFGAEMGYTVAAKTGTAQVISRWKSKTEEANLPEKLRNNSLFIAYAPINDPKIVVAVVSEHNSNAAVIARKVMDYYLLIEKP